VTEFSTYATYIRGLDLEGPIHGLLTLSDDALRFQTFERKGALELLLPEPWRPKREAVDIVMPRAEIARITDLDGFAEPRDESLFRRLLTWLNVEPNGIYVQWGTRTIVFDCERPIDALLTA
jgi:hypothetical protein